MSSATSGAGGQLGDGAALLLDARRAVLARALDDAEAERVEGLAVVFAVLVPDLEAELGDLFGGGVGERGLDALLCEENGARDEDGGGRHLVC